MFMTLCDYATVHTDGTATIVRAGIDRWTAAELPDRLPLYLFFESDAGDVAAGQHELRVDVVDPQGKKSTAVKATLDTDGKVTGRGSIPVILSAPVAGTITVTLQIADKSASRAVEVVLARSAADGHD